ncbi:MAG: ABC transporter ATP-binding protein [Desulfobacterales bacterium]|nr:ABC transporter ATP-binding protein [Desulfobacterales bacterium]MDD4072830.1 ABC transporter ATP-binding protein [Desulfobacterales bacterium]MDD4391298.1 ABC transporter ATP-binding protein [Desulfobacterales bacterium]
MKKQKNADTAGQNILVIETLSRAFGGVQALSRVSFSIKRGTVYGLIGPNGAGKTTLFNIITGIYPPDRGAVVFNGVDLVNQKPFERVISGMARTFQNVELFENMTVLENVLVGMHVRTTCGFWGAVLRWPGVRREEVRSIAKAMDLLDFVGLKSLAHLRSGDLPFGWQRLVEMARALASDPALLLLDEPAAGLNAVETEQLRKLIEKIRQKGVTQILVEHDVSLTLGISDRIIVLDQGAKLAEGTPAEIRNHPKVMTAYLGTRQGHDKNKLCLDMPHKKGK